MLIIERLARDLRLFEHDRNLILNIMKRNVKSLIGYTMGATDGEIGKVRDFYFDDLTWTIRYLIVETGSWLSGRKVLISPQAIITPVLSKKTIPVNLAMDQIRNSPDIDTDKPVSRQHEEMLYRHYPWSIYWEGGVFGMDQILPRDINISKDQWDKGNPHLRSVDNMRGYVIRATDGNVGDVADFIFEDSTWRVSFLVVDTGKLFPGKKVLLFPDMISEISWEDSAISVSVTKDDIKHSPHYDHDKPIDEGYDALLRDHYREHSAK